MPRTCTVCSHGSRRKIDEALIIGKTLRDIAGQFRGLTRTSLQRHKRHVAEALARATKKRELSIGEDILDRLEALYRKGLVLLSAAERARRHSACAAYLRELRGLLVSVYELAREAAPQSTQSKELAPAFVQAVRAALGFTTFQPLLPDGGRNGASTEEELAVLPQPEDVLDAEILPVLPQD